jgi:hypothetical protein
MRVWRLLILPTRIGRDLPATQMVVPGTLGYNPDLMVWPYDPQKAKQFLAEITFK